MLTLKELEGRIKLLESSAVQRNCRHRRLSVGQLDRDGYLGGITCKECGKGLDFKQDWRKYAKPIKKIHKILTSS